MDESCHCSLCHISQLLVYLAPSPGSREVLSDGAPSGYVAPSRTTEKPGKLHLPQLGPRRGHR